MRWSLFLLVGGLTGCLYLGGVNHEPEGEIQLVTSLLQFGKHGKAVLFALVSDPDEDPLTLEWRVKVTDPEQKVHALKNAKAEFFLGLADNLQELGKGQQPRSIGDREELTLDGLPSQGTYEVTLTIRDEQGAERRAVKTFKVKNLDPDVKLLITFDPAFTNQSQDSKYAVDSPRYPGHAPYQVRVAEAPLKNPEGDMVCNSKASISFSVDAAFKGKMETWTTKPCQGKEWLDRLRFRLGADAITAPKTKLTVKAVIDDGQGGSSTATTSIELWPNRPPCIKAADPDFLALGSSDQAAVVYVLADEPRSFAVTASEDVKTGLSYSWWVKDVGSSSFEPIIEGAAGGDLSLPAWFRLPGETVELRVKLQETDGAAPICPAQDARCRPSGEELPLECYRWVTWKVKFI